MANFAAKVPENPFFMENLTNNAFTGEIKYSAADFRDYTYATYRREGVLGPGDFWVQQSDNVGFTIKIMPGSAIVGKYLVTMKDAFNIADLGFAQNPGTTCVHRVYLVVYDEAYDANSAGYAAEFIGLESVNGSVVVPPTNTAGCIELCTITYKPSQPNVQNKDIVNTRPHAGGSQFISLTPYLRSGMAGFDNVTDPPLRAQYTNGTVTLGGGIYRTNAPNFTAGLEYQLLTLPPQLRPRYTNCLVGATGKRPGSGGTGFEEPGSYTHYVQIAADGTVLSRLPPDNNPLHLRLDGLTYELD